MQIGVSIFDKSKNFCVGYSLKNGFFKTKNFENIIKSEDIWFTNLSQQEILSYKNSNVKNKDFFTFNFDFIVNYYGYKNSSTKDKIELLFKSLNSIINYYTNGNSKLEDKIKAKTFFHEVFNSDIDKKSIKDFNIPPTFFWDHDYWFTNIKEVYGSISIYNNKSNYLHELNSIEVPYGNYKRESLDFKNYDDFVLYVSKLKKEGILYYVKVLVKRIPDIYKAIFKKNIFEDYVWITSLELDYFIKNNIFVEANDFIVFDSKRRIKELTNKEIKPIKYNTISNFLYSYNYITAVHKNNINCISNWMFSFERLYWYPIVIDFLENDLPVISYGDYQMNVSFEYEQTKKFIEICEKYNLVYPINILKNNQ